MNTTHRKKHKDLPLGGCKAGVDGILLLPLPLLRKKSRVGGGDEDAVNGDEWRIKVWVSRGTVPWKQSRQSVSAD